MECGDDGCVKMKTVCRSVEGIRVALFGPDGISGIAGALKGKAGWVMFWVVFVLIACGVGGSHLYLDSSIAQCNEEKADKADYVKIMEKLDTLHDDVVVIRASQKSTETYIKETKPKDAARDKRIRDLEIKNARSGRNGDGG